MMSRAGYMGTALVVALCPLTRSARGQAPDCTYDRCALRVQPRLGGERVVQGLDGTPVAAIGFFAPRVEPLATAGDSARIPYEAFRRYHDRGTVFSALAFASLAGSWAIYLSSEELQVPTASWALLGISVPLAIVGGVNNGKGRDHLQQAIWYYNRSTSVGSSVAAEQPRECAYDACALRIRWTPFSQVLVRGGSGERVARLGGAFPPRIDLLAAAGDSSRHHYVVFRKQATWAASLNIVSAVLAGVAGYQYARDTRNRGVADALLITSFAVGFGGSASRASADGHLQQAIWFYNRSLPRGP